MSVDFWLKKFSAENVTVIEKAESVSTNNDCRAHIQHIENGSESAPLLITAESQTGGRGRQGKSFSSPKGGLYMSLLVKCGRDMSEAVRVTSAVSVAVCRALKEVCGLECDIKWVNDIYVNGKKLCGILTEAVNNYGTGTTDWLIIGIGVNLITTPDGVNAASVYTETGAVPDRDKLCAKITAELLAILRLLEKQDYSYMDEYRHRSCVIGKNVRCIKNNSEFYASVSGIDDLGGLCLVFPDGHTETMTSGEITLRIL